jgi:hypothetical protein
MNVDLDSVDDDGIARDEEELPCEKERSITICPMMPFDDLDLTLISDSVMVEEDPHPAVSSAWSKKRK